MTFVSYHSSTIKDTTSSLEAINNTSSQILLSRPVADSDANLTRRSQNGTLTSIASIFESSSKHIMTLGDAASPSAVTWERKTSLPDGPSYDRLGAFAQSGRSEADDSRCTSSSLIQPSGNAETKTVSHRPRAGPQSSEQSEAACSTRAFDTTRIIDKGTGKGVERGRTLEKGPRFPNPLARAESRPQRDNAAIEVNVRPIGTRLSRSSTFFEDPKDPCAILEDNLLEPYPHLTLYDNVSEVINSPCGVSSRRTDFLRARAHTTSRILSGDAAEEKPALTSVFSNCRPLSPPHNFPPHALFQVQPDIGHHLVTNPHLSLQSSQTLPAREQDNALPSSSLATELPTEVIQVIFQNLHPTDFNSARHTCRSWFVSSLDRSILDTMLRRGGWFSSLERYMTSNEARRERGEINDEWEMSRHISRECALGPRWSGNGLEECEDRASRDVNKSAFVHTSTIDFTDVAVHFPGIHSSGTVFTVSTCGRFLMAANGCLIYVYELNKRNKPLDGAASLPASLRPVTSIVCPRRVIACSMDTSSHRYAIAVLLDGRMGLVCDINPIHISPIAPSSSIRTAYSDPSKSPDNLHPPSSVCEAEDNPCRRTSFLDRVSLNSSSSNLGSNRTASEPPFVFSGIAAKSAEGNPSNLNGSVWGSISGGDTPETVRTEGPSSRNASLPRAYGPKPGTQPPSMLSPHAEKETQSNPMPIEMGPRSLYRNLCSDDDPPRSVAICPQRRCVAFGCSAGIELHWVDALTGQDLNRWFPLTAPSDYLFFLPPRKTVDSAKKLRLISSAARPGERAAIIERAFGGRVRNSPFWGILGWDAGAMDDEEVVSETQGMLSRQRHEASSRGLNGRMEYSDHYRAIPLSDGYHILFTDPSTGMLCLGSDAPVGGPTKLLRKIWFQGPEGKGSPVAYAGGSDLSWGVRIIAAFGSGPEQSIWLFSVPADVFAANQGSQTMVRGSWIKSGFSGTRRNLEWMKWWPDDGLQEWLDHSQDPVPGILLRNIWPVKIRGQEIGTLAGMVDLAIDSGPRMTVWGFSKTGTAKVWQINDGKFDGFTKETWIARDGTIRNIDGEGDVQMSDVPSPPPESLQPPFPLHTESFDGTASFTLPTVITTRSERRYHVQSTASYQFPGDILMNHLPRLKGSELEGSFDEVALAQAGEMVYETFRESEHVYLGHEDLVEELTGITRIDIEIR